MTLSPERKMIKFVFCCFLRVGDNMYNKKHMVGIYKITNPNGKVYIGQSVNIENRKLQYQYLSKYSLGRKIRNSIKKYGWENHTHDVIEECSIEQLDEREIFWGKYYNVLDKNELNLKLGNGRGLVSDETKNIMSKSAKEIMTPEHRKKLSDAKLGKKRSEKAKQSLRVPKKSKENYKNVGKWISHSKPILQFDKQGNFIKEWGLIRDAEIFYNFKGGSKNNICNCCRGKQKTAYGFIWVYKEQYLS
jgi:group I intron endonuclease